MAKLNNAYTINFDEDYTKIIEELAQAYQRKPRELLRLLLVPILHDKYAELISLGKPQETNSWVKPLFKK